MTNIEVKPATYDSLKYFPGALHKTQQSVVTYQDGKPLILAGLYPENGRHILFAEVSPEVRQNIIKYKRAIIHAYRAIMTVAKDKGLLVHCGADPDIEGSDRLLAHMGFEYHSGQVWVWRKQQFH